VQNSDTPTIVSTFIYTITNKYNNKIYVGSTKDIKARWNKHKNELKLNRHRNPHMQYSYNKYGKDCFVYEILEECTLDLLLYIEMYWINMLDTFNSKYKPIDVYTLKGKFIKRYPSVRATAYDLQVSPHSINKVCRGEYRQTKGFIFRRNNEPIGKIIDMDYKLWKLNNFNNGR